MSAPTTSWDTVPVFGTYRKINGTPHAGSIRFTISTRVVSVTDDVIFPAGSVIDVALDAFGKVQVNLPAVDDPDNLPANWSIKVEEKLTGGGGLTYEIQPKMSMLPGGLDLASIITPPSGTPSAAILRGVAGGVAGLDAEGYVIDAAGERVGTGDAGLDSPAFTGTPTLSGSPLLSQDAADARYPTKTAADAAYLGKTAAGTLANLPPGSAFYVQKSGANWEYPRGTTISARPSSRTDIKMISVSTDGTVPSFAISGWDEAETVPA